MSVATALPEHRFGQDELRDLAPRLFSRKIPDVAYSFFNNSGVFKRHFALPPERLATSLEVKEREKLYVEHALELAERAASRALMRAGLTPADVARLVVTSTTGEPTPSLDTRLQIRMNFPLDHMRVRSHRGHGCASGAEELAEAADWARAHPGQVALVIAVELCGLTFQPGDVSRANLAGVALFADGAAAAVVSTGGNGPEIIGADCRTWPNTEHLMGWQHDRQGLFLVLDKGVPKTVHQHFRPSLEVSAQYVGIRRRDLQHYVMHPGGSKVLNALEDALELKRGDLIHSRAVLHDHGNISSATVLFILERFLESGEYGRGDLGLVSAMGPGFRVEHVFFRCEEPQAA